MPGLININLPITHEILSRTQPTIMDLMIALAGGAAGAFAAVSPRLSVAVVGVAVATAFGTAAGCKWHINCASEWKHAANALLLALTNIVAIQISSSLVLWAAGFRRGSDEEVQSNVLEFIKRNAMSLIFLLGLGVYLTFNFLFMLNKQIYENHIETTIAEQLNQHNNLIDTVQFDRRSDMTLVRVVLRGDLAPQAQKISDLNQKLKQDPRGKPSMVQVRFIPVQIIQAKESPEFDMKKVEAEQLVQPCELMAVG